MTVLRLRRALRALRLSWRIGCAALLMTAGPAHAAAQFDLAGPAVTIGVTRGSEQLPIAEVPNLAVGDQLAVKASFPAGQSAAYLLVVAFLRGATNPPPDEWFFPCETWRKPCAQRGLSVKVPDGAQQVLVFLAPQSTGGFKTLRSAVQGRPGAFVRASQDLNQAALDRSRLQMYLSALHQLDVTEPLKLKTTAPLLARSLSIKVDEHCLQKALELQAPCLADGQETMILNDGHSTSLVAALTSGPATDLLLQASYTPQLSYGYYSPYLASILDIGRLFDSFRTAQYQYIPALPVYAGERMSLVLNTAPSFHDPKSVLVSALPAVDVPRPPPLHAVDPEQTYCLRDQTLILPVEGAPLAFASAYAHDLSLRLTFADGKVLDFPAHADPAQGGIVVDLGTQTLPAAGKGVRASLVGRWGFQPYAGPSFLLEDDPGGTLLPAAQASEPVVVGREATLHLHGSGLACIKDIAARDQAGQDIPVQWKRAGQEDLELKLALQHAAPGPVALRITPQGGASPLNLPLQAYADPGHLDRFVIHAGDETGTLSGSGLDQVARVRVASIEFRPADLRASSGGDTLTLIAQASDAARSLKAGQSVSSDVYFADGRRFPVNTVVLPARPVVNLLSQSVAPAGVGADAPSLIAGPKALPQDAKLTFSLRAASASGFGRTPRVEVASADGAYQTVLTTANGGLLLQDAHVAVATLAPSSAFGPAAFGPLQYRVIVGSDSGDWLPLTTLVRLPQVTGLQCPPTTQVACRLSGEHLFLFSAVGAASDLSDAMAVPEGFPGDALPVPHPQVDRLYFRLRDDPAEIGELRLGAVTEAPPQGAPAMPPAPSSPAPATVAPAGDGPAASPLPESPPPAH